MRLLALSLRNYRGVTFSELSIPEVGITLVVGPNEAGKSSFAEALRLVMNPRFKDSSEAHEVRALVPIGQDVGPEVDLELRTGPYHLRFFRRYRRRPETRLEIRKPQPETLTGGEAHDRFHAILDETLDRALWEALSIQQGKEVAGLALGDARSLAEALDRASGTVRTGAREESLFARVEDEYRLYHTATGRHRGELQRVTESIAARQARFDTLRQQLQDLERDIRDLVRLRDEESGAARAVTEQEAQARMREQGLAELRKCQHRVQLLEREVEAATVSYQQAQDRAAERTRLAEEVGKCRDRVRELEERAKREEVDTAKIAGAEQAAAVALRQKEEELRGAEEALSLCARDEEHLKKLLDLEQLRERHQRVRAADEERARAAAVLAEPPIDESLLNSIESTTRAVLVAEARLAQEGPSVEVRAGSPARIRKDSETQDLDAGSTASLAGFEEAEIGIPGLLHVTVRSGRSGRDLTEQVRIRRRELEDLLRKAEARDLAGARARFERRRQAERVEAMAMERIRADLRDLSREEMDRRILGLDAAVAAYAAQRAQDPPLPRRWEDARAGRVAAESARDAARREVEQARAVLGEVTGILHAKQVEAAGTKAALAAAQAQLQDQESRLCSLLAECSEGEMDARVAQAKGKLQQHALLLSAERERLAAMDPLGTEERAAAAAAARSGAQQRHAEIRTQLAQTEARLRVLGEEGLRERLDHEEAALAREQAQERALLAQANASKLLYETLSRAREAARAAYAAPLREHLEQLGRIVYGPGFSVTFDEDLRIVSRSLDGLPVPFDSLSVGAKEQLGILLRLAAGAIVSRDGQGVPLVFDDVLGYSDPERREGIAAALRSAARNSQILILTCDLDRYRSLPDVRFVRLRSG